MLYRRPLSFFYYLPLLFRICIGWREMNGLIRTDADGAASKKVEWPILRAMDRWAHFREY